MSQPCHYCSTVVAHGHESEWGEGEIRARWVDTDGSVSDETYLVCLDCLRASAPGGPGYQAVHQCWSCGCVRIEPHAEGCATGWGGRIEPEPASVDELHRTLRRAQPCDKCGALGPYERGAHHTRRVPHNGEMEWDVFPICDSCAAARGDARR